ncbi:hypothetical protein BH09PSE2_BH09PSE2_21940 [soil metagenome]
MTGLGAGAASAQGYRHDRQDVRQDRHDDRRDDRGDRHDNRGGGRHWNQGQRLDNRYGAYAPVNDWRSRRLAAPRRGYQWVRSGDDYVPAALVGGLIASVVAASR